VRFVHLDVPESVIRERLARRARDPDAISDADAGVFERFRKTFERPAPDESDVIALVGERDLDTALDTILAVA
ncbi:MAG: AAA family ATPase, partial [Planctomycetes bacterium]|nr:AAA family ATPase [Planctomycetota bacterium]